MTVESLDALCHKKSSLRRHLHDPLYIGGSVELGGFSNTINALNVVFRMWVLHYDQHIKCRVSNVPPIVFTCLALNILRILF